MPETLGPGRFPDKEFIAPEERTIETSLAVEGGEVGDAEGFPFDQDDDADQDANTDKNGVESEE